MSVDLRARGFEAILLDVEGTTTPVGFVHDVLFPFARRSLDAYLHDHLEAPHLADALRDLHREWREDVARGAESPPWHDEPRERRIASLVAYGEWLIDRDRKSPGLKALQGHIWEQGYRDGRLHGQVFPDVPAAFERWRTAGLVLAIFSSGSVLAQQMLFRTVPSGDLTVYISAFFDLSVGPKTVAASYARIASALGRTPARLLFVSDSPAELQAARAAGCAAMLCVRPDDPPTAATEPSAIHDFSDLV